MTRSAKEGGGRDELKAALYALTLYCGDERFGAAIGVELNARMRGANRCAGTTLEGRDDLPEECLHHHQRRQLSCDSARASHRPLLRGGWEGFIGLPLSTDGRGPSFLHSRAFTAGCISVPPWPG